MKRAAFLILVFMLMLMAYVKVNASGLSEVVFDGKTMAFTASPVVDNGVTMAPAADVFKALNVEFTYDGVKGIITAVKRNSCLVMQMGSGTAKLDGNDKRMPAAPVEINSNIMIPLRFVCEAFGARVYWNEDLEKIIIYSGDITVCKVVSIIDKCTMVVDIGGVEKIVITIGIEGADSILPDPDEDIDFAARASQYAYDMLVGRDVYLEFDEQKTDWIGRLQAYIFSEGKFYNAELIKNGYAAAKTMKPNVKYDKMLIECQKKAMSKNIGMWEDKELKMKYEARLHGMYNDGNLLICIDAGHGGSENGAVANGYLEKNLNLFVSILLKNELEKCGFNVILTRSNDADMSLAERADIALNNNCDAVVSCHFNAYNGSARGFEAIYTFNNESARWLAECIGEEVANQGIYKRGVWTKESESCPGRSWYGILRDSEPIPGVILEGLFIDNPDDIQLLEQPGFFQKLSAAYAKGICKAFGLKYIE